MIKITETNLKDCFVLEPKRFGDERGYFSQYFTASDFKDAGISFEGVVQANRSKSGKGIVRGLHFQKDPYCQAKIVECVHGAVLDCVVDIREGSPTYGDWTSVLLTPENGKQLFVPRGFAHGFVSLKDDTLFQYLVDNVYAPESEGGIAWDDPDINIDWQFDEYGITTPVLSEKDSKRLTLKQSPTYFKY